MQQLIATIENLLTGHDCVVVPGLGGFIHQTQEARYDQVSGLYYPAGKQLAFNAQLRYNDGLLCQAYQMEQGLSFEQANASIRQAVDELKTQLSLQHQLKLGRLGLLVQTSDDSPLVFKPALNNGLCIESFGLKPCTFPSNRQLRLERSVGSSHWLAYVATAAACFLLLFTFLQDSGRLSWNDADVMVQEAAVLSPASLSALNAELALETESLSLAQEPMQASEPLAPACAEPLTEPLTEPASLLNYPQAQKQYLIVIASFPNPELAEQYIRERHLQDVFPAVGVAVGEGHSRVYAQCYASRQEAVSQLATFRQSHSRYAKAWVLVH